MNEIIQFCQNAGVEYHTLRKWRLWESSKDKSSLHLCTSQAGEESWPSIRLSRNLIEAKALRVSRPLDDWTLLRNGLIKNPMRIQNMSSPVLYRCLLRDCIYDMPERKWRCRFPQTTAKREWLIKGIQVAGISSWHHASLRYRLLFQARRVPRQLRSRCH
jgi:hypothetical protein